MKKRIGIALVLALALILSLGTAVLADDPLVQVTADTHDGTLVVQVSGIDTSSWNTGSIGQTDTFTATGGFTATFESHGGNYGALGSYINADGAYGTGATFQLDSYQDFDVLVANHYHGVEGNFTSIASASDDQVAMNLKTVGSMSVWSEATNPWYQPGLLGGYIYKGSQVQVNSTVTGQLQQWVNTDGTATMSNSNIWGWGIYESGSLATNYGSSTLNVSATGDGEFVLTGWGGSGLDFSGNINTGGGSSSVTGAMPSGGSLSTIFNFVNGMTGDYSMTAN